MSTTTKARIIRYSWVVFATLFILLTALAIPQRFARAVTTSDLSSRSAELQRQIDEGNKKVKELGAQANTLQNKLNGLNGQISQVTAQIELTTIKINELNDKLEAATKDLDRQKSLLRASMRELYVSGDASTIEMLANSNNFSEFINEQKYLEQLKTGIQDSTKRVIVLKQQIEEQKSEQEKLKEQQEAQKSQLSAAQNEQATLLAQTKGDEAAYQAQVAELKKAQAAVNAELASRLRAHNLVVGGSGGYPAVWANAPQDSLVDNWGMYNRECVSYTAWKVWSTGRNMPYWGGHGNANQWPGNARADGIPVDFSPRAGDVAISMAGYYGHAMYVERVNSDGTIYVSQYNFSVQGEYSEMTISTSGLYFIHF
jgi:surface antigen